MILRKLIGPALQGHIERNPRGKERLTLRVSSEQPQHENDDRSRLGKEAP